jgi:hypothetical protein
VRVHLARKHALELDVVELFRQARQIAGDGHDDRGIVFHACQFQEFARLLEIGFEFDGELDLAIELGAFAPEFLGPLGVGPDLRTLELATYLDQAFLLGIEVKVTPEACARGLRGNRVVAAAG